MKISIIVLAIAVFSGAAGFLTSIENKEFHRDDEVAIQDQILLFVPEANSVTVKLRSSYFGKVTASVEVCSIEEGQEFCSVFPSVEVLGKSAITQSEVDIIRSAITGPRVVLLFPSPASRYFKQQK